MDAPHESKPYRGLVGFVVLVAYKIFLLKNMIKFILQYTSNLAQTMDEIY